RYQVSVVRERTAGGNTYRMHAQFERTAGTSAAQPSRDLRPSATGVTVGPRGTLQGVPYHPGWTTAHPPKTTAHSLPPMLAALDVAFNNWLASPAGHAFATGSTRSVTIGEVGGTPAMTGLHSIQFGGIVRRVNGQPTLTSAWVEASWF